MSEGILIDEKGQAHSDRSWELVRRFARRDPARDLATHAVLECGFIHIRPQEGSIRVALRAGGFTLATLGGALYELREMRWRRIMLAVHSEGEWFYEMLATVWDFAERAEHLAVEGPVELRARWLAAERHPRALALPNFAQVRPLARLWEESRGRMPDDFLDVLGKFGLLPRSVLLRQLPRSSRLVVMHFGPGIKFMRPCEALEAIGRDFQDLPDRPYGAWASGAYVETLAKRRLRVESVRATIRTSEAATLRTRYDRILMPWRGAEEELFILGVSVQRAISLVA
jgi:hypothetical protein